MSRRIQIPTKDLERKNGFLRLRDSPRSPVFAYALVILASVALCAQSLPFLIFFCSPFMLFYLGCQYATRIDKKIDQIKKLPAAVSPRVIALETLAGAQRISFFGKYKIAVAVDSFIAPQSSVADWFSAMAVSLDREVQAVLTTGGPTSHGNGSSKLYRIMLVELKENESPQKIADAIKHCIEIFGVTTLPVDEAVFRATAGHDWWYAHGYNSDLRMDTPLPQLLKSADHMGMEFEFEPAHNFDCTTIVTVRPGAIHKSGKTIEVGLDIVMFGESKSVLSKCEYHFLHPPRLKIHSSVLQLPPKARYPNINVIRRGKLKIGAAFIETPLEPSHRFLCLPPPPELSADERDQLHKLTGPK